MGFFGQIGDLERFVEAEPERLPEAIRIYQKEVHTSFYRSDRATKFSQNNEFIIILIVNMEIVNT